MTCPHCNQEVALARRCPYCGRAVPAADARTRDGGTDAEARGRFRGRVDDADAAARPTPRRGLIGAFFRFLGDEQVPSWKKFALFAAVFIMIFPDLEIPVVGWLGDGAIGYVLVRWLTRELQRYLVR